MENEQSILVVRLIDAFTEKAHIDLWVVLVLARYLPNKIVKGKSVVKRSWLGKSLFDRDWTAFFFGNGSVMNFLKKFHGLSTMCVMLHAYKYCGKSVAHIYTLNQ